MESVISRGVRSDFTIVSNTVLRDSRLSWKAKGLFAYLLYLPDNWVINCKEVMSHSTDGETSFKTAMKELKKYGYLIMTKKHEKGRFVYVYEINEHPEPEEVENEPEKPKKDTKKIENKVIDKTEEDKITDYEKIENKYFEVYSDLYKKGKVSTDKSVYNYSQMRTMIKRLLKQYSVEQLISCIDKAIDNKWVVQKGFPLAVIFSSSVLNELINGKLAERTNGFKNGQGIDSYNDEINF